MMQTTATVQVFDGPGQPLRLEQWPLPEKLAAGEALVQLALATICGSDLHTIHGRRTEPTPAILGHEGVGRVVRSARQGLGPGDRVTWTIADSCGRCPPCAEHGLPQKCRHLFKYGHASLQDGTGLNGCYASHILLRAGTHIVPLPDEMSDEVAVPANCALATVVNACARIPDGCQSAVVQGAGLLGLYACVLLRERGVADIYAVDIQPQRMDKIAAFGAVPIDGHPDRYSQARRRIVDAHPHGVDAVIEVAGVASLVPEGVALLRVGGTYVFVGMVHPDTQLELTGEQVIRKCLTIAGVHNYAPWHLDEAVALLAATADRYPYAELVSPPLPLAALPEAVALAETQRWPRVAVTH